MKTEQGSMTWAIETMMMINKLTPEIKGKAFDLDWFMLRQRLEEAERTMNTILKWDTEKPNVSKLRQDAP